MTVIEIIRNAILAGLGVQEKIRETIDDLVKRGELSESQAAKLVKELSEKAEKSSSEASKTVSDLISGALEKMNLPTKDDIEDLQKKVRSLSKRLKTLEQKIEEGGNEES